QRGEGRQARLRPAPQPVARHPPACLPRPRPREAVAWAAFVRHDRRCGAQPGQATECATGMTDNDRIPQVPVVDDEPHIRELVQVALKFHGCAVSTAAGGMDAIRQAEALRPDLIVLDVVMPDLDGFEVCRRLRAMGNEVPVIFLTARDTSSDTVTGLALG